MEDIRGIKAYWADHRSKPPANPITSFLGKTVIVTGANIGLGYEAAAKFYRLGTSKLILAVRDLSKGNAAKSRILARGVGKEAQGYLGNERIEVWHLDMLSYPSVKAFVERVSSDLDRVDVVVLNAGIAPRWFKLSEYGWETALQVNVLSTTLLALLVLPKLRSSRKAFPDSERPVLEFLGSGAQYLAKIKPKYSTSKNLLAALSTPEEGWGVRQYNVSKLFVQHVVRVLAAREAALSNDDPSVYILSCCPGAVRSEIARDYTGCFNEFGKEVLATLLMRSTEEGSRTIVSGVLTGAEGHGNFWQHDTFPK
ncbi:MAG: hypothetical protein Q9160_001147 [Pyrenula sp. 1 TL-2023]